MIVHDNRPVDRSTVGHFQYLFKFYRYASLGFTSYPRVFVSWWTVAQVTD